MLPFVPWEKMRMLMSDCATACMGFREANRRVLEADHQMLL
jgi:hypothetical protein